MAKNVKIICQNPNAGRDYFLNERFEAGIELTGTEIKSLRQGKASLKESFAQFEGNECYILNMHIPEYSHGNRANHDPRRKRKLLLHRHELDKLQGRATERGLTLIPTKAYFSNAKAKIEIALGKGKKFHDKREDIKRKDMERDLSRDLQRHQRKF